MNAIDSPATAFATSNLTKFRATPSPQSDESTTILAGPCRNRQSSACTPWSQATRRGNLGIIDIICRNLVLLRRKSSVRSRRIVSDLAYPPSVARNFRDHFEIPRFQKHKSALAWSHLQGQMVNQMGDASERRWLDTAGSSQRFTRWPDLMEDATFANDL
jgi:hypothetical protein